MLTAVVGRSRARKLRRYVQDTGLEVTALLKLALDLLACNLEHMPRPKNSEAQTMALARAKASTPASRHTQARRAGWKRWHPNEPWPGE